MPSQNRSIFTLVAANSLEGEEGNLEILRGKNVGICSPGSLTDFFMRIVLRDAGIDPDQDVTIVGTADWFFTARHSRRARWMRK